MSKTIIMSLYRKTIIFEFLSWLSQSSHTSNKNIYQQYTGKTTTKRKKKTHTTKIKIKKGKECIVK